VRAVAIERCGAARAARLESSKPSCSGRARTLVGVASDVDPDRLPTSAGFELDPLGSVLALAATLAALIGFVYARRQRDGSSFAPGASRSDRFCWSLWPGTS
jgi:hypothetical protein